MMDMAPSWLAKERHFVVWPVVLFGTTYEQSEYSISKRVVKYYPHQSSFYRPIQVKKLVEFRF